MSEKATLNALAAKVEAQMIQELSEFASLMVDEVIARIRVQFDSGLGLCLSDQRLLLEQLIIERRRNASRSNEDA